MSKFLFMWLFPVAKTSTGLFSWTSARAIWAACIVEATRIPIYCFISGMLPSGIRFTRASIIATSSAWSWFCVFLAVYFWSLRTSNILTILYEHIWLSSWLGPWRRKLPGTFTNLCQCTIVAFLSLLDHLNNITLCCVHQIGLCRCQADVGCSSICHVLVAEIVFVYGLWVTFSSLWTLWATLAVTHFWWSFAGSCAAGYGGEVWVCAGAICVDGWILFVWGVGVGLGYLIFQTDLAGCA